MSGTSSGTYTWFPPVTELVLDAFERCGKADLDGLNAQLMQSAKRSMNMVLQSWSNRGVNLWTLDLVSLPLAVNQGGEASPIAVDSSVIDILDVYRRIGSGLTQTDLLMFVLSRDDYAAMPVKTQQGPPTSYWFDRFSTQQLYIWPLPDLANTYTLRYYCFRRVQDADAVGAQTPDIPLRFVEAFTAGLAAHLSWKWAPDRTDKLLAYYEKMFQEAQVEDREKVPLRITPSLAAYNA